MSSDHIAATGSRSSPLATISSRFTSACALRSRGPERATGSSEAAGGARSPSRCRLHRLGQHSGGHLASAFPAPANRGVSFTVGRPRPAPALVVAGLH